MEFIKSTEIKELSNPGVISRQLLNPDNSESKRVTITEVHLEVGACQPRHTHDASEQIWYAVKGCGTLLLENDRSAAFQLDRKGDEQQDGAEDNQAHKRNNHIQNPLDDSLVHGLMLLSLVDGDGLKPKVVPYLLKCFF